MNAKTPPTSRLADGSDATSLEMSRDEALARLRSLSERVESLRACLFNISSGPRDDGDELAAMASNGLDDDDSAARAALATQAPQGALGTPPRRARP